MSIITDIINRVKVVGAAKASKSIKHMGNAAEETRGKFIRLGDSSASTGKQFSTQASGLGGLVAAYAGAAATIFAVQQAFTALSKAAEAKQLIVGTKTLAAEIGESGDLILAKVKEITKSQLTLAESSQNVNIALSAGFSSDQIERLTTVSLKASRALGRNLTDALQRLVRGTAKLEPELLDEIGIFTRIDPALRAYAQGLNRSVSSLTTFEKRQAFVTAALEEGERKFGIINTSLTNSQSSIERLSASVIELATDIGILVADTLAPLADFFSGSFGNTLLAFGGLFALVFSKSKVIIKDFAEEVGRNITKVSDRIIAAGLNIEKISTAASGLSDVGKNFGKVTRQAGTVFAGKGFDPLKGAIKTLASATTETPTSQILAAETEITKQKNIQKRIVDSLEVKQQRIGQLNKNDAKTLDIANKRYKVLEATSANVATNTAIIGTRTVRFANAAKAASRAFAVLGVVVNGLLTTFNIIFGLVAGAQLIGSLFDIDILDKITKSFREARKEAELLTRTTQEIIGIYAGTTISDNLKDIGVVGKDVDDIYKNIAERVLLINNRLKKSRRSITKKLKDQVYQGSQFISPISGTATETTDKILNELLLERKNILVDITDNTGKNSDKVVQYKKLLEEVNFIISLINKGIIESTTFVSDIVKRTGGSAAAIAALFKSGVLEIDEATSQVFLTLADGSKILAGTTEGVFSTFKAVGINLVSIAEQATEEYEKGFINAEKLSSKRIATNNQLKKLDEEILEIRKNSGNALANILKEERDLLALSDKRLAVLTKQLVAVESLGKDIATTFGSEIGKVDKLVISGAVNTFGAFATTTEEVKTNQIQFLEATVDVGKALENQYKDLGEFNSKQKQQVENSKSALKALLGGYLNIRQELKKIIDSNKKILLQENNKIKELKLQIKLQREQTELQNITREAKQAEQLQTIRNEIARKVEEIGSKEQDIIIKRLEAEKSIAELRKQNFDKIREFEETEIQNRINRLGRELSQKQVFTQARRIEEDATAIFSPSQEKLSNRKIQDAELEYEYARRAIDLRRLQIKEQASNAYDEIKAREELLRKDLDINSVKIAQEQLAFRNALAVNEDARRLEQQKIQNTINQLEQEKKIQNINTQIERQKIQGTKVLQDREVELLRERVKLLKTQVDIFEKFINDFQIILTKVLEVVNIATNKPTLSQQQLFGYINLTKVDMTALDNSLARLSNAYGETFDRQIQLINERQAASINNIQDQIAFQKTLSEAVDDKYSKERSLIQSTSEGKIKGLVDERGLINQKIANLATERAQTSQAFEERLNALSAEELETFKLHNSRMKALEEEKSVIGQLKKAIGTVLKDELLSGFKSLFTEVINGTKTAKEAFRDMFTNILLKIQEAVFDKLIGNTISSILAKVTPFAGGGLVRSMAGGGSVPRMASGGLRDSVPAMLEPGEFVVRKPMVSKIGASNLQSLNAHGSMPSTQPTINIHNEGTPQEASKQPEVKVDAEKMIIDIFLKDYNNNGPIRQTLRGGKIK